METAPVEWLIETDQARARVLTLAPGEVGRWHRHAALIEHAFGLDPGLTLELRGPDAAVAVPPGGRCEAIPPGRVHRAVNRTDHPVRYLLIQDGPYDFLPADAGEAARAP
jgi:quercetin dioxygenase-like cupin family protein